jgi:hypothetical protein
MPSDKESIIIRFDQTNVNNAYNFDQNHKRQLHKISFELMVQHRVVSQAMSQIGNRNDFDELSDTNKWTSALASLMFHNLTTIEAATDLMRRGYREQVPILLRHVIEAVATSVCISTLPEAWDQVQKGTFKSSKAVSLSKENLPIFGEMYGLFTNHFSHLHSSHFDWQPFRSRSDEGVTSSCIDYIKSMLAFSRIAIELAFYPYFDAPQVFQELRQGEYTLNENAIQWLNDFLELEFSD